MPRGGRRGRFWQRFHRDSDHNYEEIPPPPPPPNMDHFRWTFSPTHRRANRRRTWHEGTVQDGSSSPRWQAGRMRFVQYDDETSGGENGDDAEICYVCGDLLSNHPEVPTIHLCDSGDYAIVEDDIPHPHATVNLRSSRPPEVPRRNHEARGTPPPSRPASYVEGVGPTPSTSQDEPRPSTSQEETMVDGLHQRLYSTQQSLETVNTQIQTLCEKLKCGINMQQGQSEEGQNEIREEFAEKLVGELQEGLQEQYSQFVLRIKQHITDKSSNLDAELTRLVSEKSSMEKLKTDLDSRQKELEQKEDEMTEVKKSLDVEVDKLTKDSENERTEIRRQWQKLNDEIKRMEDINNIQQSRVRLDVGGHQFTTSTSTLIKDSESMLAAMFSGRHELKKEADGTVFIDRDGTHFRYILNYLRDGITDGSLPDEPQILRELLNEAVYFQITGLVEVVEEKLQS